MACPEGSTSIPANGVQASAAQYQPSNLPANVRTCMIVGGHSLRQQTKHERGQETTWRRQAAHHCRTDGSGDVRRAMSCSRQLCQISFALAGS
jgi:hypothetical protein